MFLDQITPWYQQSTILLAIIVKHIVPINNDWTTERAIMASNGGENIKINNTYMLQIVADLGTRPLCPPLSPICFHFHAVFGKNYAK